MRTCVSFVALSGARPGQRLSPKVKTSPRSRHPIVKKKGGGIVDTAAPGTSC